MALDHKHFQHDAQSEDTLPCGRHIVFSPLNGHSQKRLMPNDDGRFVDLQGAITAALTQAIRQVNGRSFDARRMESEVLAMPEGSRLRAFALVSGLTYGSEMNSQWDCPHCKANNKISLHVDEIPVTPYGADLLAGTRTFLIRRGDGQPVEVRLRAMTGTLLVMFQSALARKECSPIDRALAQVAAIDGTALTADKAFYLNLLSRPAWLLDAIRSFVLATTARVFASEESEAAWKKAVVARLAKLGVEPPEAPARELAPPNESSPAAESAVAADAVPETEAASVTSWLPREGFARHRQIVCESCQRTSWHDVDGMPDFFFRHLTAAVDI